MSKAAKLRREIRESKLAHRYAPLGSDPARCWYCGDNASGVDHVPPLVASGNRTIEQWEAAGARHVLVPSCGRCNARLGTYGHHRLSRRVAYLYVRAAQWLDWYRHKYRHRRPSEWALTNIDQGAMHNERLSRSWERVSERLRKLGEDPALVLRQAQDDCAAMVGIVADMKRRGTELRFEGLARELAQRQAREKAEDRTPCAR